MTSPPECPATPPRRHVARFPNFGHVTPKSVRPHRRNLSACLKSPDHLSSPGASPFITPKTHKFGGKISKKHAAAAHDASIAYLPTPLTVDSGRKLHGDFLLVEPSSRSKSLTAALHALASSEEPVQVHSGPFSQPNDTHNAEIPLRTPSPRRTPSPPPKTDNYSDSDDDIQIIKAADLKNIPRLKMDNPFLETPHMKQDKSGGSNVDYSTHLELVNHRTGKKVVQKLTEEEQRFKPRKLVFTLDVTPSSANYNIAHRFIDNTMGHKFTTGADSGSSKLDFSIFSDSEGTN